MKPVQWAKWMEICPITSQDEVVAAVGRVTGSAWGPSAPGAPVESMIAAAMDVPACCPAHTFEAVCGLLTATAGRYAASVSPCEHCRVDGAPGRFHLSTDGADPSQVAVLRAFVAAANGDVDDVAPMIGGFLMSAPEQSSAAHRLSNVFVDTLSLAFGPKLNRAGQARA